MGLRERLGSALVRAGMWVCGSPPMTTEDFLRERLGYVPPSVVVDPMRGIYGLGGCAKQSMDLADEYDVVHANVHPPTDHARSVEDREAMMLAHAVRRMGD